MPDTAESLLKEHLVLCSQAYGHGLVPTDEKYWADCGDYITLCTRWYWDSDLKRRTLDLLKGTEPQSLSSDIRQPETK
jgi:hypothetical protein